MKRALLLLLLGSFGCDGDDDGGDSTPPPADAGPVDSGDEVCETWVVEYDLSIGSQFDIRNTPFGAGDQTNDIGPGSLRLRFPDDNGAPGAGQVTLLEYDMEMDFEVMMVVTDITVEAGPENCGVATGSYDGTAITWSTPIRGFHAFGSVTCNASEFVCGVADLPHMMPDPRDSTTEQALMPFVFSSSTATVPPNGFLMDFVEVPNDDAGDTFLRLVGRETARNCVSAPSCP